MTNARSAFIHFSDLPLSRKILFTGALCVLGFGYLTAIIFVVLSNAGRDGQSMLTVKDIVIAYAGTNSGTKLESALKGPMSRMLQPAENMQIVTWVRDGTKREEFEARIGPLMEQRCVVCHNRNNPHLPSLDSYEGVMKVAERDTGMAMPTLIRVAHIHLFGLTFIFFITSFIFCHSYFKREWLKAAIIATPFVSIIVDIGSWYLTKVNAEFAWLVIGSGGVMGTFFAIMLFVSLYQMWLSKERPN